MKFSEVKPQPKQVNESRDIRLLEKQLAVIEKKKMSAKDDPCWNGYHMVGTKTKNGREVPNCVPGKKGVSESNGDPEIRPGMKVSQGTVVKVNGNTVVVKASNGNLMTMNIHDVALAEQNVTEETTKIGGWIYVSPKGDGSEHYARFRNLNTNQNETKTFQSLEDLAKWLISTKTGFDWSGYASNPPLVKKLLDLYNGYQKQGVTEGSETDKSHGSPFDRGSADSYYHRPRRPHKGGVGGGSGERIEDLTPEEIKAYHAGYDYNERLGDKKVWDSKDNNLAVTEDSEPGDVRTKFALQKARQKFPMAKSDAEALALYINNKEQKDVDELGAENDYEDMMIDQLSSFDDRIDREVDDLQRQIDMLKKNAGLKKESASNTFMNSGLTAQQPNRAGYNKINSKEEWLEKVRVMHQVQNDPKLKDDAEAQEAIRQRIGDLNRVGIEQGWAA